MVRKDKLFGIDISKSPSENIDKYHLYSDKIYQNEVESKSHSGKITSAQAETSVEVLPSKSIDQRDFNFGNNIENESDKEFRR